METLRRLSPGQWIAAAIAVVAAIAFAVVVVSFTLGPQLREALVGDTVERRIDQYMQAVIEDDRAAAMDAWRLDGGRRFDFESLAARRDSVTSQLMDLNIRSYSIEGVEWWRTCCEPGVIDGPRNAGLGRAVVWVDTESGGRTYFFDVAATPDAYVGDAGGSPPHNWALRDVYPSAEKPIYAAFADVSQWYSGLREEIQKYFERYADAMVTCDVQRLWTHYPELAKDAVLGAGINSEEAHVRGMCGVLNAVTFDLERRAPMLLHGNGAEMRVTIHGSERWDYKDGVGGSELLATLTLRRTPLDGWVVVRTDRVTDAEYHEQH